MDLRVNKKQTFTITGLTQNKPNNKKNKKPKGEKERQSPPRRNRKPKQKMMGRIPIGPILSECALKYALACADPMNPASQGACVPVPGPKSQKVTAFARFTMTVGSSGYGAILISPCVVNDLPCIWTTNNAFEGAGSDPLIPWVARGTTTTDYTLAPAWDAGFFGNMPYATGDFEQGSTTNDIISARMVSIGAQACYTGTELNKGGLITPFVTPNHNNISAITGDQLGSFRDAVPVPFGRKWCRLTTSALNTNETCFMDTLATEFENYDVPVWPFVNAGGKDGMLWPAGYTNAPTGSSGYLYATANNGVRYKIAPPSMVYLVTSSPGNTVFVELYAHVEYAGMIPSAMVSRNPVDVQGANSVMEATSELNARRLTQPTGDAWTSMKDLLSDLWNEARPHIIPATVSGVSAALSHATPMRGRMFSSLGA